jgi:hypothetical protein
VVVVVGGVSEEDGVGRGGRSVVGTRRRREGTETRAERGLRIVRERVLGRLSVLHVKAPSWRK